MIQDDWSSFNSVFASGLCCSVISSLKMLVSYGTVASFCRKVHVDTHGHPDVEDPSCSGLSPGSHLTGGGTIYGYES